jgi:hypothetical protein
MPQLFEHLTSLNVGHFVDLDDADATAVMGGQAASVSEMWDDLGAPDKVLAEDKAQQVRDVFGAVVNPTLSDAEKKKTLLTLKVPNAVKHLAGMLSQYDWEYVTQAKEIRGYVVAKLLEESTHPDAKIRLRALNLLGNLTEVGSFTERIEVTKKDASTDELEARIRSKLKSLLPQTVEIETVEIKNNIVAGGGDTTKD